MKSGKPSRNETFMHKYTLFFALTSILPILTLFFVLDHYGLIKERYVVLLLGFIVIIALLGFFFIKRIIKKISMLAKDFVKVEQGKLDQLGEQDITAEFSEMTRISIAFNKTLAEMKAHAKELESLVEKINTLSEMTELVSRIPDIEEVLQITLKRTMAVVNAEIGSIMLVDEKSKTLRIATSIGLDESIISKTIIRMGENISGKVAQTGEAVLVEDIEQDSRFRKANDPKYENSSFISMPLRAHWRVMGVLNLSKKGSGMAFSDADLKFLTTLLGHIGFALENARLLKEAKESAKTLGRIVGEQNLELDQARGEVLQSMKLFQQAQKLEAVGTLAGGLAHNFNNLLMAIQGNLSLILLDTDSSQPHFERLKNIEQHVQSGADLSQQLLGFARGGKFDVKSTDLNKIVEKTSVMFGRTKKEIKIQGRYQKDIWSVEADQGQIEQVLLNLYVNAWQAMPGGGQLFLQTENVWIDEDYIKPYKVEPGKYVKLCVTDTGVGMDDDTQQRIFEPFFSTKDTETGSGTGLGLASSYGIIKNHDGFINVYSEKGHGTTFNIYLPTSEKATEEEQEIAEETLKGTETVLLVDDEDMIIEVGEQMLKKLGYEVLTARSAKEALDIYTAKKDQIDMVILDIIMPDMGGSKVYDRLKEINPEIKVLLSSGYSINGLVSEILNRGCNGFIQKPFNMWQLSRKIREILEIKEGHSLNDEPA